MPRYEFTHNDYPTLGVEIELQLVDANTLALSNSIEQVLQATSPEIAPWVKPELMQCYLEINTGVCRSVGEVREDLSRKLEALERVTDSLGLRLLWAATHPFSSWRDQKITVNDRYAKLVELMQDVARRLVTFGLHVHVGLDTGDKAIMVCDRIMRHLPTLLALTANSPFWEGRATGLASNRSKIMEGLPTAGLPAHMRNWSEYVWLVDHLVKTGFINTIREIWWDVRPHNNFGTVEVRVCDMPASLDAVLAITALVQSLVTRLSEEIDQGTYLPDCHPMIARQNKWRAVRYGADAQLVDADTYEVRTLDQIVGRLVDLLAPTAEWLGCLPELESLRDPSLSTASAKWQSEIFERTGSRREVVRTLLAHSRLTPEPEPHLQTSARD